MLVRKGDFRTFTSCEDGKGHSFRNETVGLELEGSYRTFQRKVVTFLQSHGINNFTISLVTDYPEDKSVVYLEGLDLLSAEKKR